jgi:dimethylamine---corrinoid protein Co-methyltransferase
MDKKYFSRMGDGSIVYMTKEEIQADIAEGIADAAKRGKIEPLSAEDAERIYEIITMPGTVVGVEHGRQVVSTSDDGSFCKVKDSPIDRMTQMIIYERFLGADSVDMGQTDYNYKTAKAVVVEEVTLGKSMLNYLVMPVLYGGMPNLGYYTKPDGPVDNWAELLPAGRVEEALKAQEEAVDYAVHDIVYVAKVMREAGIDGINLDTAGAAGDADFLAALIAAKEISTNWPELGIEMGMAGEFVLGMHGKLEYEGTRLAGLYPHKQVKLAEAAGVSIFGPVVNTNTNRSLAWNLARTCTFIKACSEVATIPIHPNVGMGVCGVPMTEVLPVDAVTRVGKALIEICNVDGL